MVPYPVNIQETPIQVQEPLGTPLVGLPFPNLNNFREFDQNARTVRTFPLDQMVAGNPSQSILLVVTLVADMAGSSAAAQQPMFAAAQQPMPTATQWPMPMAPPQPMPSPAHQPRPSTSIPVGGMAQQPLYTQTT